MKRPSLLRAADAAGCLLVAAMAAGCLSTPLHQDRREPAVRVVPHSAPPEPVVTRPAPSSDSGTAVSSGTAPSPEKIKAAESAEAEAIAAALQQVVRSKTDYRISAADLLNVTVYQNDELNRKVRVNANGTVSMPLIGAVKIGGMTLIEAQESVEGKLAKYLVSPQVSLFIEDYGNKMVYVMGEVQKPGSYPIPTEKSLTVLEAISTAGGFTPIAGQDRTRVLRNVNGASVTYTIAVKAITQDGQKEKDIVLEPNDVIYVPQSFF